MMRIVQAVCLAIVTSLLVSACDNHSSQSGKLEAALKGAEKAYYKGDFDSAARLFQALAERGNVQAEFFLGDLYLNGSGVPKDYAQALKWSREAADHGNTSAQFTLGKMSELGLGVPQDYVQAYVWYSLSASSGDEQATRKRDQMRLKMNGRQLDEAERRTKAWLEAHR